MYHYRIHDTIIYNIKCEIYRQLLNTLTDHLHLQFVCGFTFSEERRLALRNHITAEPKQNPSYKANRQQVCRSQLEDTEAKKNFLSPINILVTDLGIPQDKFLSHALYIQHLENMNTVTVSDQTPPFQRSFIAANVQRKKSERLFQKCYSAKMTFSDA